MKILVFGTSYVDTPEKLRMFKAWCLCMQAQDGDFWRDVIDSQSPLSEDMQQVAWIWSFPDNIGHLALSGRDGWGRAFCAGIQRAIDYGFDYVVHVECDIAFDFSIQSAIEKMVAEGKPVASCHGKPYGWLETGIMAMDVEFLKGIGFIERYDWPSKKSTDYPERIVESIIGSHNILWLPLEGCRDDAKQISDASGMDYITHCSPEALDSFMARFGGIPV